MLDFLGARKGADQAGILPGRHPTQQRPLLTRQEMIPDSSALLSPSIRGVQSKEEKKESG